MRRLRVEIRQLREERIKVRRMDKEETKRSRNGETESEGESVEYMNQMSEEIRGRKKGEQRQNRSIERRTRKKKKDIEIWAKKMEEKENEMGLERVYREEESEERREEETKGKCVIKRLEKEEEKKERRSENQ